MLSEVPSAADLRAEIARHELPLYILAARVRLHPVRLGRILKGRLTLTPEVASRIRRAIESESGAE